MFRLLIVFFILFLNSCSYKDVSNLESKIISCRDLPYMLNYITYKVQLEYIDFNDKTTDSLFLPISSPASIDCFKLLEITNVELAVFENIIKGGLFYTKTGLIIYFTKSDYYLSPRYQLKKKLSNQLYIVRFIG